jgi:C_GCAxxG_C_C family probable redox protein
MKKDEKAVEYFRNKFNCSQSVLAVFGQDYGLTENECLKVACAFGGGMGRQQHTCGAVTGALLALGLNSGKGIDDPEEKKSITYLKTREFFEEFIRLNGSVTCLELLDGLNMTNPGDYDKIVERKLFDVRCEKFVSDAVRIAERLISK